MRLFEGITLISKVSSESLIVQAIPLQSEKSAEGYL